MADIKSPAAPQAFTFGTNQLSGVLLSYTSQTRRRGVVHQFLKRKGALVEDMNGEPRSLEVQLVFVGKKAAKDYNDFEDSITKNPVQLLNHPTAGKYTAFCMGAQANVNLAHGLDEIHVRVAFTESELDSNVKADIPDVATAAQSATSAQSAYQKVLAAYTGALAQANCAVARSRAAIVDFTNQISEFTDPVTTLVTGILALPGVATSVIGALQSIMTLNQIIDQQMTSYIESTEDVFSGASASAGDSDNVENLLGVVRNGCDALETLLANTGTPAGSAEAVGSLEEALAACYVLSEAVQTARPATIVVTVAELTDLISWCQRRYPLNALQRALDIMTLNQILNPAAIPAGTRLVVPVQ